MLILVINCGSSSIKYQLIHINHEYKLLAKGVADRIGLSGGWTITHKADPSTVRLGDPAPTPRLATAEIAAARHAVCAVCDSMRDGRCSAAGCGCAGEAKPDILSSRCPLSRWPIATIAQ